MLKNRSAVPTHCCGWQGPAAPGGVATLAHTLTGSARGIGAWRVARAAEALELAGSADADLAGALDRLAAATDEARAVIAELLRAN